MEECADRNVHVVINVIKLRDAETLRVRIVMEKNTLINKIKNNNIQKIIYQAFKIFTFIDNHVCLHFVV